MKITVVGAGYVGLSNAVLFAQRHEVKLLDISPKKTNLINRKISPIQDAEISEYLATKPLNLHATTHADEVYADAEYIIIATPTDYDPETNYFDTSSVESVLETALANNDRAYLIIKSTIPVGFTVKMREKFNTDRIIFSPEFLRESKALHDNLYPSRIVVGDTNPAAERFAEALRDCGLVPDAPIILTNPTEAESIKLFSNTYLALRVAFFNELDSFAAAFNLDSRHIIDGVSADPRIGTHYKQSVVRLRRLLPAQRHQTAIGKLRNRTAKPHRCHRRIQQHPQRLHHQRRAGEKTVRSRRIPPDHEIRFGQFPQLEHPGRDETHQGTRRPRHRLRTEI